MSKLSKIYEEYKKNSVVYQKKRKELLCDPEKELHELAKELNIYSLRDQVMSLLSQKIKKTWRLYRKIYNNEVPSPGKEVPDDNIYALGLGAASGLHSPVNSRPEKIESNDVTKDADDFLLLADEIMTYEDFITIEQMKVWKVTRDLVWAYRSICEKQ